MYTSSNSDLYWKIHRVFYKGDKYIKLKMTVFYKSNDNICHFLNPMGKAKGFKIIRSVYDTWETFDELN